MKSKDRQPTIKPGVKYGYDIIPLSEAIQELPDPEGHLTEEQKKWPIVDDIIGSQPIGPAQPSDPITKSTTN